jgi:hypothetical protein
MLSTSLFTLPRQKPSSKIKTPKKGHKKLIYKHINISTVTKHPNNPHLSRIFTGYPFVEICPVIGIRFRFSNKTSLPFSLELYRTFSELISKKKVLIFQDLSYSQ